MPIATTADLGEMLRTHRLLSAQQLGEVEGALRPAFPEPRELARELVRRSWLTPLQVNALFLGRASELVIGPYVLLERVGAGAMGQVFKARHQHLGRLVAVKVVRKDRVTSPNLLKRFLREMQAAGQMSHPNIVLAFDAGETGNLLYFVMEYVEGTDLGRRLKREGALPVAEACDYVRQTALGLQHAFEKGLVHRDVKPSNLMVTERPADVRTGPPPGVVKILDLGLALLSCDETEISALTQEGLVMGTVDYLAPEQALDSHGVDTRADLYSLGCTFYHLLTGRVPYPGGTVMQRLLRHRTGRPRPVESLRPEVPRGLAAVVRKLMARCPEDRYQTPAELAEALAAARDGPPAKTKSAAPTRRTARPAHPLGATVVSRRGPLPPVAPSQRLTRRAVPKAPAVAPEALKSAEPAPARADERPWGWVAWAAAALVGLSATVLLLAGALRARG
jgi:eukaryotic-like serine/threonine-protein kinase